MTPTHAHTTQQRPSLTHTSIGDMNRATRRSVSPRSRTRMARRCFGEVSAPAREVLPLVALLLCAGCGGALRISEGIEDVNRKSLPNYTPEEIVRHVESVLPESLNTFVATASLSAQSPAFSGNLTARIAHRKQDSLYLSLLAAPLGIEVARFLATPDSFFYYDRLTKSLSFGSLNAAVAALPFLVVGDSVFRVFLGLVVPDTDTALQLDPDLGHYVLQTKDLRKRWIVDTASWRVVLYEELTKDGRVTEAVSYSDFDIIAGVRFPRSIIVRRPGDKTNVSIHYREIAFNPGTLSMQLHVPNDVVRILVGDGQ